MSKIGIFYGSTTGNTEAAAEEIGGQLDAKVHDIGNTAYTEMNEYDVLILGSSTWGMGEIQDDWEDVLDDLESLDLTGKKVALFGTGDSAGFEDTFCDAIGILYETLLGTGAQFIGQWPTDNYEYSESRAEQKGVFIGLPLDEENQGNMTAGRISNWVEKLKTEIE
jgi:flavodoxin I